MTIKVTFKSRLTKVGNKYRSFEELFKIAPAMVLDAFKANNNLVLSEKCRSFLAEQTQYKGVCKCIISLSNYRLEREIRKENSEVFTTTENLSGECYRERHPHGILFGVRYGF